MNGGTPSEVWEAADGCCVSRALVGRDGCNHGSCVPASIGIRTRYPARQTGLAS
jgi:hypothetical protein